MVSHYKSINLIINMNEIVKIISRREIYIISDRSFYVSVRPTHSQLRASCNIPAIVSGVCGLLVGIGIGIGFGALIFNPYRAGKVGGGIWFGKKRRKRGILYDEDNEEYVDEKNKIIDSIDEANYRYEDDDDEDDED